MTLPAAYATAATASPGHLGPAVQFGLAAVAAVAFPIVFGSFEAGVLTRFVVYGILAMSFDLLWGYAGILNFAQVVFFAGGAYTLGLTLQHFSSPVAGYVALVLAVMVPAGAGIGLGLFLFLGRVRGTYLAVATLVIAAIAQALVISATSLTGGLNGLKGIPVLTFTTPAGLVSFDDPIIAYYGTVGAALATLAFSRWLVTSSFGTALRAIDANETRAAAFGYPAARIQLVVFTVSAAIAGLAGGLFVSIGYVSPDLLGLELATSLIVWVTIGGRGTLIGAFVGAVVVSYLQFGISEAARDAWYLVAGIAFVGMVLVWPSGAVGFASWVARRWRR
jgi:urea transport system permease protein